MPAKYEMQEVSVLIGMVCDICGEEDLSGCNDFVLRHIFGYGSPIDGNSVEAAVCDRCLEKIIREHIPNAQWIEHN